MFERFTEGSRAVIIAARDIALELGSPDIGVGQILYGCAEGREETAGRPLRDCGITSTFVRQLLPRSVDRPLAGQVDSEALSAIGIDFESVRAAVEETFGAGALEAAPDRRVSSRNLRRPPFSLGAKRSLEFALRITIELHQNRIVPGHLLLGLIRLDDEFVSSVISESGTTVAALSAAVLSQVALA